MSSSSSSSPFPEPPKEAKVQRLKFIWRALLISNFALGAYIFASARKKNKAIAASQVETKTPPESVPVVEVEPSTPPESEPVVEMKPSAIPPNDTVVSPPIIKPLIERDLIPAFQQQQLFKWILEEKRKIMPRNEEEKQQIAEDMALLEHYIHSDSIPKL